MTQRLHARHVPQRHVNCKLAMLSFTLAFAGSVQAFEIDTGNEDVQIRWDNTVRYNLAQRLQDRGHALASSLNVNDGNNNFGKNSVVGNRIDLLSEFDFVYKKDSGFRVSAVGWGDAAYNDVDGHAAGSNHLVNGLPAAGLSQTTKRYNRGVSGEWLDAFLFTKLDLGDAPLYLKLGQHAVYWGEGLFFGGAMHGVAYAQSPLDISKALAIPGVEAKELFRPLNSLSATFQAADTLSLSAQYFLDWKPNRFSEAGSYLAFSDLLMNGGESIYTPLGLVPRLDDIKPSKHGDFGLSAKWSPEWLDGSLGLYYRNFTDKIPQAVLDVRGVPAIGGTPGQPAGYRLSYGDDIDLYGVSLSKNVGGVSVGAELSYRHNMPLASDPVIVASPTTIMLAKMGVPGLEGFTNAVSSLPDSGDTGAARGNTMHGVLNFLGQISKTPMFDSADWRAELTYSRWLKVTQHEELFKGRSGYVGLDRASKDAWGFALMFEPKWYQVLPGVDLLLPVSYSVGLSGNSPVVLGGNKDAGSFSIGVGADVKNQYRFDLKYVGYFGKLDSSNPTAVVPNDPLALLKDRGMLVFNFKTTF